MERMAWAGKWDNRWLTHRVPTKAQLEAGVLAHRHDGAPLEATELEEHRRHAAHLYLKGSLHSDDRFLMQVRLSLTERSYATAGSDRRCGTAIPPISRRTWPRCWLSSRSPTTTSWKTQKAKTPAMKLALAKGVVALKDILCFSR